MGNVHVFPVGSLSSLLFAIYVGSYFSSDFRIGTVDAIMGKDSAIWWYRCVVDRFFLVARAKGTLADGLEKNSTRVSSSSLG